jgi:hypothetical protein
LPSTQQLDNANISKLLQEVVVSFRFPSFAHADSSCCRHFFRALFQRVAVDKGFARPAEKMVIGNLPGTAYASFPNYVAASLKKLKLDEDLVTAAEAQEYVNLYAEKEDHIRIAWTLSAILAPIIESYVHTFLSSVQAALSTVQGYRIGPISLPSGARNQRRPHRALL